METYWENMHPPKKRMRGRVGALVWYLERLNVVLPAQKLQAKDRPAVEELKVIAEKFREVVFEKFEDQAPALGPLKDNIERILIGLPQEKPKPKPPEKKPAPAVAAAPAAQDGGDGGGGEAAPAAAASSAPAAGMPAAPAASMGSPEDLGKYMRDIGMSMLDAGKKLRKAQATSPEAYRLIRLGMWLEILQPPPIQPDGNTMIPGLPDALRQKLNALDSGQTWPQLLDEAESSMLTNRLNLDLQRYALKAMGGLGPAYDNVRKACINALRDLLDRLPAILRLSCKDGSLLADQNTKEWIKEEILTSGGGGEGGGGGGGGGSAIPQKELAEAKKLASGGKPADAMAIFEKLIGGASDGRSRFQIRLAQADVARRANNIPVARAMFESLDEEARALNLERWEPGLVVECLVGYLSCLRASRQKGEVSPEEVALYRRLAQLKPSLAVEMGT
jgi:type VI secretion system protein VasJ